MSDLDKTQAITTVGQVTKQIEVSIGPQFLNLFSEQLYSSPNKAFEELAANSWDAGATVVHIHVADNLSESSSIVWVLDNGESMDENGLALLWNVATSPKKAISPTNGRPQIGKFGIGKLATYVLAHELTYICRAKDGKIRAVTMDYRRIDKAAGDHQMLHINPLPLNVREISNEELKSLLETLSSGEEILSLIENGIPTPVSSNWIQNEFGGDETPPPAPSGTWTLVVLTTLKPAGRKMQTGWIRRLLRTALPLGSSISIRFNDEVLSSSKIDVNPLQEWVIGPELDIETIDIPKHVSDAGETLEHEVRKVTYSQKPYPHACIDGVAGRITGSVKLFEDKISGGKSEAITHSNGFFVNILGRVVNPQDPYFGLENLNHSAWAKFRATVRADGLNSRISVNREDLQESSELIIFRAFLKALFNKARSEHDKLIHAAWPDAGEVLTNAWAVVPTTPLRNIVNERIDSTSGLPDFIDLPKDASEDLIEEWKDLAESNPSELIKTVEFETALEKNHPLSRYDLSSRRILVNFNHPFALEHCETNEAQKFVRDIAFVDLLTDIYMLDVGIDDQLVREVREYRDQLLRTMAQLNRKSGIQIAFMLDLASKHEDYKALETITGDALEYLGYSIQRLAQPGEPEGIATAPLAPEPSVTGVDKIVRYSFNYDAKSSTKGKSKTGNLSIDGVVRHRAKYEADYSLIVAPDFQIAEKLLEECKMYNVTPIRARDLGRLVVLTASYGPIDLKRIRLLFDIQHPDEVSEWITKLHHEIDDQRKQQPQLTLELFIKGLEEINYQAPNSIHIAVIAQAMHKQCGTKYFPNKHDVKKLVDGLEVFLPSLIRSTSDGNVILSTSPSMLREAIKKQVSKIPEEYQTEAQNMINAQL